MDKRFQYAIAEVNEFIESLAEDNKNVYNKEAQKLFPPGTYVDKCYFIAKETNVSLRIVIHNNGKMVQSLCKVLEMLTIPYNMQIDAGYTVVRPDQSLQGIYPSRSSSLPKVHKLFYEGLPNKHANIRDRDDIVQFLKEWNWEFDSQLVGQELGHLVSKVINNHDQMFGIIRNSKFVFYSLEFIEIYINAPLYLFKAWSEISQDATDNSDTDE